MLPVQRRIIGLFFAEPPSLTQVQQALLAYSENNDAVTSARFARVTPESERAARWTRDPNDSVPTARLAFDLSDEAVELERSKAIIHELAGNAYICLSRTPKALPLAIGETFHGTLQLCCFTRLKDLSDEQLQRRWFDDHTDIALETQSTLGYYQNRVIESSAPLFDGIVEEYFPPEASDSTEHFFAAVGDPHRLKQHIDRLTNSSQRFIDLSVSPVIHLTDTRLI